ncbi:permease-like cell division protein FtsX [Riemerella anatipestifer]|uniref:permease-like cell division protein FtsX n=1 Tax=Riemerella anatipestifer TaxID=34085 RepID=UPI0021A9FF9C|nr:permease-like cell division protein FtsX [Riemerella anatipestifer]
MKQRLQTLIVLFFVISLNAQSSNWIEIKKNYFQKVIIENSKEFLAQNDSLEISTFEVEEMTGKTENFEFGKFLFGEKIVFEDLKSKLEIKDFNPNLKKNSEYLIKIDIPKAKALEYNIYLNDSTKIEELNNLKEFLKENFQPEKIIYISKEDAAKEAKKQLGIATDLFEENIFPASIEITTKNRINLKELKEKYPEIIDDITSNEPQIKSMTLKIKT